MPLAPGTRLGVYEITALIGSGGMGEVYRATDTSLKRDVAVKILPEAVAADPDRLARFRHEAQLLASLNHPNIAGVYGLTEQSTADGSPAALAMELVGGRTLADRIAQGPIDVDEALGIARQIAQALEAAHQRGIVHRDLKPANVVVRADGAVKVLDFGLAKAVETSVDAERSTAETVATPAMTEPGVVLGTAAYMSPEQARGLPVDRRADVWALGVVLYEMLTGRRAFEGDNLSDTIASVLRDTPDWTALPADLPPRVRLCLDRCLTRDSAQRIADAATVRQVLEGAFDVQAGTAGAVDRETRSVVPMWRQALPWLVGVVVGLGVGMWLWRAAPAPDAEATHWDVVPDAPLSLDGNLFPALVIAASPRNDRIAYAAGDQLWMYTVNDGRSVAVDGTEGAVAPFFKPDGSEIGFFTSTELKAVAVTGGAPNKIADVSGGLRGAWSEDGTIVYGERGFTGLFRVPETGGTPEPLTVRGPGERDHDYPFILPGGEWVLFTHGWFPWDRSETVAVSLRTGERREVLSGGFFPVYARSGHLLYALNGNVMAAPFDADSLTVTGDPVRLVTGVYQTGAGAQFGISADGTLVYVPGNRKADADFELGWVTRTGEWTPIEGLTPHFWTDPAVSPDGTRVAVCYTDDENVDIWIWDDVNRTFDRLTSDEADDDSPMWVDNERIVFRSDREGGGLFEMRADRTGQTRRLAPGDRPWPLGWGADGRLVLSTLVGLQRDIMVVGSNDETSEPLWDSDLNAAHAHVSPDGRLIAYESDESGRPQVYVRTYPDGAERITVSVGDGRLPRWSDDGVLYYIGADSMMETRVSTTPRLSRTTPERLFDTRPYAALPPWAYAYDVAPDGRFLMLREIVSEADLDVPDRLEIVRNAFSELTRLTDRN